MKTPYAIQQWVEKKNYKCYYILPHNTIYHQELNNWCQQNIKGEWAIEQVRVTHDKQRIGSLGSLLTYIILFKNERDRTWFILNRG